MTFVILYKPLDRVAGTPLVDKADRAALVALYKATVEVPMEHENDFETLLNATTCAENETRAVLSDDESDDENETRAVLSDDLLRVEEHFRVITTVNKCGRIILLRIFANNPYECTLNLPEAAIESLEHLENVEISNCKVGSLPYDSLSKLPNLFHLSLHRNKPEQFASEEFSFETTLPFLKSLHITGTDLSSYPSFFAWIRNSLPSLERFNLQKGGLTNNSSLILDFPATIQDITMYGCGIDDHQLETFIFDVLPNCPALKSINLGGNNIRSFQSIHQRLEKERRSLDLEFLKSTRLSTLKLEKNPIEAVLCRRPKNDNREEVEAARGFLRAASTIQIIWCRQLSPDVGLELFLNSCGRHLLGRSKEIPKSLWPLVLARIQSKSYWIGFRNSKTTKEGIEKPTAVFHFLAKSSIFAAI